MLRLRNFSKKFLYLLFLLGLCLFTNCSLPTTSSTPSVLQVASGRIERLANFPSQFISPRNVDIWLPEDYDPQKRYAVLYMHDGQMLYDSSTTWNKQEWGVDETLSKLLAQQKIRPCIVVGIWNGGANRHAEYFPQKAFEQLPTPFRDSLLQFGKRSDQQVLFATPPQSDRYLQFLTQELKPFIDQKYATRSDRANTFVAGSSMGGLISMYAICEYPHIFGGAACLSTHWIGIFEKENNPIPASFLAYLDQHLPEPSTHKIYFDYGTETLDALYEEAQLAVDTLLQARYPTPQWKSQKFVGADHSERAWKKRFSIPIRFLLGK